MDEEAQQDEVADGSQLRPLVDSWRAWRNPEHCGLECNRHATGNVLFVRFSILQPTTYMPSALVINVILPPLTIADCQQGQDRLHKRAQTLVSDRAHHAGISTHGLPIVFIAIRLRVRARRRLIDKVMGRLRRICDFSIAYCGQPRSSQLHRQTHGPPWEAHQ